MLNHSGPRLLETENPVGTGKHEEGEHQYLYDSY